MSISFDGDLQVIDLDVSNLIGLSSDEIEAKIMEVLPDGMSDSEITAFKEDLNTRLEEIKNELEDLQNGYEDSYDASETTEGQARYEFKIEEAQEAIDLLDTIDEAAQDALERETFLNVETDSDISFTYDSSDLNQIIEGDTVNLTALAGSQSGIFDTTEEEEEEVTDINGDGFITYEDYNTVPDSTDQFAGQDVFLQINSGDQVSYVSESGTTATFKVTTADGKSFTINVNGNVNIYFQGSDYLDTDALSTWPEDILQRCYDNDDTMNMYDRLNDNEISDSERLGYIEKYDDIANQDNFNAIVSQYALGGASYESYSGALEQLFGWIDDTSSTKDGIEVVWNQIYTDNGGVLPADLITALALGVAMNGNESYFQTLFGPVISKLETSLGYNAAATEDLLGTNAKVTIMLLETQAGVAGQLGGPENFWSTAFATNITSTAEDGTNTITDEYTNGKFSDHDSNIAALPVYQQLLSTIPWTVDDGMPATTLAVEQAAQNAEDIENGESEAVLTQDQMESMRGELKDLIAVDDSMLWTEWFYTQNDWKDDISTFMNALFTKDENGEWVMNNPADALMTVMSQLSDGNFEDTVAANIMYAIDTYCPTLAAVIFTQPVPDSHSSESGHSYYAGLGPESNFIDFIWEYASNGGDDPPLLAEASAVYGDYN